LKLDREVNYYFEIRILVISILLHSLRKTCWAGKVGLGRKERGGGRGRGRNGRRGRGGWSGAVRGIAAP
jgi:hypothetical protein